MNKENWVVIYDNGWEEVKIEAVDGNALRWLYEDQAGELEEFCLTPNTSVDVLRGWLESHSVNSKDYRGVSDTTHTWEQLMRKCAGKKVGHLVETCRENGLWNRSPQMRGTFA